MRYLLIGLTDTDGKFLLIYPPEIQSSGYQSEDLTFKTAPISNPFNFVAFGDTRTDSAAHQMVVNAIIDHHPDFALNVGDLVGNGTYITMWNTFFNIEKDLMKNTPYMPIVGNHEHPEDNACKFYYLFALPNNEKW